MARARALDSPVLRRLSGRAAIGLVSLTLALTLVFSPHWLSSWDELLYDIHLQHWSRSPNPDITIVAIDEVSLQVLGRWPWSRRIHAELIEVLGQAGAAVIAFDIAFPEPDRHDPKADEVLAQAIAANGSVILPVLNEASGSNGLLVETLPLPALTEAAAALGHVDVALGRNGIARGVFLKAGMGTSHWSSLGLAMLEATGAPPERPLPGQRDHDPASRSPYVWVRDYKILLPFAGPPGTFERISYVDVLQHNFQPGTFANKMVLVGMTASGLADALSTPVSGKGQEMPGVEYHANVLDTLRNGLAVRPLDRLWLAILTSLLVLLPVILYPSLSARAALFAAGLLLVLTLSLCVIILRTFHLWFPPSSTLFVLALGYPLWSWRRLELAVRALARQKARLQVTLDSIGDAVITTDPDGHVDYMNPAAEQLTGWLLSERKHALFGEIVNVIDQDNGEHIVYPVHRCIEQDTLLRLPGHSKLVNRYGKEYAVRACAAPIRDSDGQILGVVIALSDVTEACKLAEMMAHEASHDALTQLPNRVLLMDRLAHAIAHARRSGQQLALLFLDLDRFKAVNDGLGHSAGDALLEEIARRLVIEHRKEDTVARLGGDEFVILLENLNNIRQVGAIAHKIRKRIEFPIVVGGHELCISGSIGISLFPKDGEDPDTLLKNADTAMYQAKGQGRNNVQFYAEDMNKRALERLKMERDLRLALERHEFKLFYQPQLELRSERTSGMEALLRWHHPRRGMIQPSEFIPLAEDTGLIVPIGEWVLSAVCRQIKYWEAEGLPIPRVAVNLSPRQFLQRSITESAAKILERMGLGARTLELEITESLIMQNVESTIADLRGLKAMGFQLAIDDFGTGYSCLSYLQQFPIDRLKIDKSFVQEIKTSSDRVPIVLALIAMAHSMQLKVIAEGVETHAQYSYLKKEECDELQGFCFSQPLPAEEMTELLRSSEVVALQTCRL